MPSHGSKNEERPPSWRTKRVDDCADWEAILDATAGFHDAVVREAAIVGEEFVDRDHMLKMSPEVGASVKLFVQVQQRSVPAVELTFGGVQEFVYNRLSQVDPARCTVLPGGAMRFELASAVIVASWCEVSLLDASSLGSRSHFQQADQ
jgi:hypothetical protein